MPIRKGPNDQEAQPKVMLLLRCDRSLPTCSNCFSRPKDGPCVYDKDARCYVAQSTRQQKIQCKKRALDDSSVPINESVTPEDTSDLAVHNKPFTESTELGAKLERLEALILRFTGLHSIPEVGQEGRLADQDAYPSLNGGSQDVLTDGLADDVLAAASCRTASPASQALWTKLMAELAQVRIHLKRTSKVFEHSAARYAAPGILSGAIELMPIPRILRQLPPRHICDKLINIFFTKLDPALSILHQPSFRQVYEDFWLHKASTSPIWLAILCTAPRIAVHICIRDDSSPPELEGKCANLTVQLRSSAAQCLQYADYSRPQEGVIEALILAQYADYASSRDINPSVWVMHGLIIRLSVTMGYHLDSEAIPGVSAFQLEMRRRCWTFIRFADILFSFQLGYPSTLHPRWLDAPLPRNLNDTEFDRHPRELPPSLPANGVTSASVLVSKARLSIGFAQAVQGSSKAPMYNDQGIAGHEYALEDMMQTDFDTSLFGFDLADPAAFVSGIYSGI